MNHELSKGTRRPAGRWAWAAVAFLSVTIALGAARYFLFIPAVAVPSLQGRLAAHDPFLLLHIAGGMVALALGAFQFRAGFRNRHRAFHRWSGRVYLVAVMVSSVAGFRIALQSQGGVVAHWGFGALAIAWFATAAVAYLRARALRFRSHGDWMLRNFSLTFAAVTLRLWLPLFTFAFGWPFLPSYRIISWLAWVPNLLFAEWWLSRTKQPAVMMAASPRGASFEV